MESNPAQPEKRPFVGIGVIVIRRGRVLLGRRRQGHGAGTWQFPGGHLEYGESIEACARRELFEETGLTIQRLRMGPFTNDLFLEAGKHYVTLFVIAEETTGAPQVKEPDKCAGWNWFRWSEMPSPHFLPIVNLLRQGFAIAEPPSPAAGLKASLATMACPTQAKTLQRFFKTGPGQYGEGDLFLGIRVPDLRRLARRHRGASLSIVADLLRSPFHEHRQLALFLLIHRFQQGDEVQRMAVVAFYLAHTARIDNWDLVDCSAPAILGSHLLERDKAPLYRLARSPSLWERRMAVVASLHFIRAGRVAETLRLARHLLGDQETLIHKAVGWMLREVGKRNPAALVGFLRTHYQRVPRTTLRYAIERFPEKHRRSLLRGAFDALEKVS